MAELDSNTSCPRVSPKDWLVKDSKQSLNDKELFEQTEQKITKSNLQMLSDWCTTVGEKHNILDIWIVSSTD